MGEHEMATMLAIEDKHALQLKVTVSMATNKLTVSMATR